VRRATPNNRPSDPARQARAELEIVLGQRKLLERLGPGLLHAFVFWGFLVLFPTILMAMIAAVSPTAELPWLEHQTWFGWMADVFVVLVFAGIGAAAVNRAFLRPERFRGSHSGDAYVILLLIFGVIGTLLCWHAAAHAQGYNDHAGPVSNAFASLFPSHGHAERVFVWAHLAIVLGFLLYLPRSKHLHIATAAITVWFARTGARGRLEPLRFDVPEEELRFGVAKAADLTRKQVLDAYSCTECGRCQDVCPAHATGKLLSPKLVIMGVRDQVFAESEEPILGNGVPEEMIWDCVTCGACVEACPVSIEHVDHIVDLRRSRVMVDSAFPAEAEPMLRDVERAGNPWGKPQTERADWAAELGVRVLEPGDRAPEYLYWVGCAASFDERARASAQSTARLLQAAGVDFAILGPREACTGDPARRIGNEYVFQAYAEQNVATLDEQRVRKIVASCPHCFNTLANEYVDFGGAYEVVHHSELLAELVREGRLSPVAGDREITYHDSCYLARHNDVRMEPRQLVAAVGKPVEMERRGRKTFCCGAGGAHMWMEEGGDRQINVERADEALATGAETLAVACPFCTVMLDDGVRETGAEMRVADVATLLVEALEAEEP
jgi:Fe-S oxidoreductase/nitrate reductase gamma subunit